MEDGSGPEKMLPEALQDRVANGAVTQVFSLTLDDENAVPLGHEPICKGDEIIGQTSSCAFGFRVGKPVALGKSHHVLATGDRVKVDIARTLYDATVTLGPLFDPEGTRVRQIS